jgi:radical SAM protein with 4Fe4S-binding SPASM domain
MDARQGQAIVFEHVTPPSCWRPPLADPGGAGFFFAQRTRLPAGAFAARFQIMLPFAAPPPAGARVVMEVLRLDADPPEFAARGVWSADAAGFAEREADRLMLDFALEAEAPVEVRSWASADAGAYRLRAVKVQRADRGAAALDWSGTHGTLDRWPLDRIRNVVVGNSGVCTASCLHCPTNKPWLPVARGEVMPDRVFDRLLQGLVECGLPITGAIGFGLFADPLTDRQLARRIRQVKAALPGVPVTVSTTGAAFAPRQAEVVEAADAIGVHVESLVPETYERLMAPLRFDRVIPRVEALVRLAGPKARLAVPVHRENLADVPALEAWWAGLGGGAVTHQPFSNRLSAAPEVLGLHLSPVAGACTQDLAYDLVVDWDGRLVNCCSDFARASDLGSLQRSTLPELIADARRERLFRLLRERDWQRIEGCRTCLFDDPVATQDAVASARAAAAAAPAA